MAFVIAIAFVLSGLTYLPKTASAANVSDVNVLGATLRLSKTGVDNNGAQSMRVGIQVNNADTVDACAIELTVGETSKVITIDKDLIDGIENPYIYSKNEEDNTIIYAVVITGIPEEAFSSAIGIKGIIKDSDGQVKTETNISKSVDGIVKELQTKYKDLVITLKDGTLYKKRGRELLTAYDIKDYDTNLKPSVLGTGWNDDKTEYKMELSASTIKDSDSNKPNEYIFNDDGSVTINVNGGEFWIEPPEEAYNDPDKWLNSIKIEYKDVPDGTNTGLTVRYNNDNNDKDTSWGGVIEASRSSFEKTYTLSYRLGGIKHARMFSVPNSGSFTITSIVFGATNRPDPDNPATSGTELIQNGQFLSGSNGLDGWSNNGWPSGEDGITVDKEEQCCVVKNRVNNFSGIKTTLLSDHFEKGQVIEYSLYIKAGADYVNKNNCFGVAFGEDGTEYWNNCKDESGNDVNYSAKDWTLVKGTYTVSKETSNLYIVIAEGNPYNGFSTEEQKTQIFYVKDVSMKIKNTEAESTPEPTADIEVNKTDAVIDIDGNIDDAWEKASAMPLNYNWGNVSKSSTTANARMLWDKYSLYILAEVKDTDIATNSNDYECDGIELFLDPDFCRKTSWAENKDAFHYRYTGLNGNSSKESQAVYRKIADGGKDGSINADNIESAYKKVENGYVIEIAVPIDAVKDTYMGFELTVMDCYTGGRDNEMWLIKSRESDGDMKSLYQHPDWMGVIKLVE